MRTPASRSHAHFFRNFGIVVTVAAVSALAAVAWHGRPRHKNPAPTPVSEAAQVAAREDATVMEGRDAARALDAAQQENDLDRRDALTRTALQNLARVSPDAAASWVLRQSAPQRLVDASIVLIALSERPDDLVRIATRFCAEDASYVREHGDSLLTVLTATGDFQRAVEFASHGGPERNEWVARAFSSWAELSPQAAAEAALRFEGDDAVSAVYATWSAKNRATAEQFVRSNSDFAAAQRSALASLVKPQNGG